MTVGEKIKQRRLELNMSQDELAKKCGYKSRSSINKIELSRDLPLKKVRLMANALDLTVAYLMGWEESSSGLTMALERRMETDPDNGTFNSLYDGIKHKDVVENITDDECNMIRTFRSLDEESKRQLVLMLAFLKNQNKK